MVDVWLGMTKGVKDEDTTPRRISELLLPSLRYSTLT